MTSPDLGSLRRVVFGVHQLLRLASEATADPERYPRTHGDNAVQSGCAISDASRTVDLTQQKTCVHVALICAHLREPLQAAVVRRWKSDRRDREVVHDMPPCLGFPRGRTTHQICLMKEGVS